MDANFPVHRQFSSIINKKQSFANIILGTSDESKIFSLDLSLTTLTYCHIAHLVDHYLLIVFLFSMHLCTM